MRIFPTRRMIVLGFLFSVWFFFSIHLLGFVLKTEQLFFLSLNMMKGEKRWPKSVGIAMAKTLHIVVLVYVCVCELRIKICFRSQQALFGQMG